MKKALIGIFLTIITCSESFAADLAKCEIPKTGDPQYRVYLYTDADSSVKSDLWTLDGRSILKGRCGTQVTFVTDLPVPTDKVLFECTNSYSSDSGNNQFVIYYLAGDDRTGRPVEAQIFGARVGTNMAYSIGSVYCQ